MGGRAVHPFDIQDVALDYEVVGESIAGGKWTFCWSRRRRTRSRVHVGPESGRKSPRSSTWTFRPPKTATRSTPASPGRIVALLNLGARP